MRVAYFTSRYSQATQALAVVLVLITFAAIIGVGVVRGQEYFYMGVAAALGVVVLLRPAWGMVGYLILAATLKGTEGVSTNEIAIFALLLWQFLLASIRMIYYGPRLARPIRAVIGATYIFFALAAVSLAVAVGNDITFRQWARDVSALGNLALIIIMPAFIRHDRDIRLLRTVFLGLCVYIGLASTASLLGLPFLADPLSVGGTWIYPILVSAAAASLSEFVRIQWKYIAIGGIGLLNAFASNTRTIWVGILVVVIVSLLTNLRAGMARRNIVILLVVVSMSLLAFGIARRTLGTERWEMQQERFGTLQDLSEDQSFQIRAEQRRAAYEQFRAYPLFGVGLGYQYEYHIPFTIKYEAPTNFNHSDFANYLCKMGIVGIAALAWLFLATLVLCSRLIRFAPLQEDRWIGRTGQISLLAAVVMANSTPILQERGTTFILGFLVSIIVLLGVRNQEQPGFRSPLTEAEPISAEPESEPERELTILGR
jgi:hypothetical protein